MTFVEMPLKGAFVVEPARLEDERGFFTGTWCQRESDAYGLNPQLVQCSISFNKRKGSLRGKHYQVAPYAEAKLVHCTMGAIFDVIIDLRPESPTFKQWMAVHLSADNRCMLYIPEGCAHGFQTLVDDTEVFYQMSEFYHPECARGVRWDDPAFCITWPDDERIMSPKDQGYPTFEG